MAVLVSEKCVACRRDSPTATEADIEELSPQIPDWELISEDGIPKLTRSFRFSNFREALDFSARVVRNSGRGWPSPANRHRMGTGGRDVVDPQDSQHPPQRLHHGRKDRPISGRLTGRNTAPAKAERATD